VQVDGTKTDDQVLGNLRIGPTLAQQTTSIKLLQPPMTRIESASMGSPRQRDYGRTGGTGRGIGKRLLA